MGPTTLDHAKRVAADVHFGAADKKELLAFRDLIHEGSEFALFLRRLSPELLRYVRTSETEAVPHQPEGEDKTLFLHPLPGEVQMRAAYEVAIEGFLEHLEARGYPVVERGGGWVKVYISPKAPPLSLEGAWKEYVEVAFSLEELSRGLLPLLNSVKLADKGFSVPEVPLVTLGERDFLAAWYLSSLLAVRKRLSWRDVEIARLEKEVHSLPEGEEKTKRLQELKDKQRQEIAKYLEKLKAQIEKLKAQTKSRN